MFELVVEKLASIDLNILGIIIAAIISGHRALKEWDKKNKVEFILNHIPAAWSLANKIAKKTEGKKDDHYVGVMKKLLEGFGWELKDSEIEAVKAQGSAFNQTMKVESLDPLDELNED